MNEKSINIFTLFTTSGTLICCALPIIFVTIGMGATVAAMTSTFPFLITLSHYPVFRFNVAAFRLVDVSSESVLSDRT